MRRRIALFFLVLLGLAAGGALAQGATISSPANGATLAGSSQAFQWNDAGASGYQLWVGNAPGGYDIGAFPSAAALTTGTSVTATGLPTDGRLLYVRLWSYVNGAYQFTDASYGAAAGGVRASTITSPASGSTLAGASQTFTWSNEGASYFQLWVGSTPGAYDIAIHPNSTDVMAGYSATVSGLPTDGRLLYVRLWSDLGGVYGFTEATYTAASAPAAAPASITSPVNGSTLAGASQLFQWNDAGAAAYQLWVGNSAGTYDIGAFPSPSTVTTSTSLTASGLPTDGRALHVRLWSNIGGAWQSRDFTYTAASMSSGAAAILRPAPGSTIALSNPMFEWSDIAASGYQLWVGSSAGAFDLGVFPSASAVATGSSAVTSRLPTDGRTLHVRLWSLVGGQWIFRDHTYTTAAPPAQVASAIVTPMDGQVLDSSVATFRWVDAGASHYELWIGSTPGSNDVRQVITTNTLAVLNFLPTDGRLLHVRLHSNIGGVPYSRDYTYRATTGLAPAIHTPPNGFILPYRVFSTSNSFAQTFRWPAGVANASGAARYRFWAGSSPGASNLADVSLGTLNSLTRAINFVPDTTPVHVRLWADYPDGSHFRDFAYATPNSASRQPAVEMSSPSPGEVLPGFSSVFWGTVPAGARVELWLGNSQGARDLGVVVQSGCCSGGVTGFLPRDGRLIYARLWTHDAGGSAFRDYVYRADERDHTPSRITSPAAGSTLPGTSQRFAYDAGSSAFARQLWVGSTPRSYDLGLYDVADLDGGEILVSGLPTDGRQVHATLWTYFQGIPYPRDVTFNARPTPPTAASITSPVDGSTITGPAQDFTVNQTGASFYGLKAFQDGFEIVFAGCAAHGPTSLFRCDRLPTNGRPVTIVLSSFFGSDAPLTHSVTYNTPVIAAELTRPADGSLLPGPSHEFAWRAAGANRYELWMGTAPGTNDLRTYVFTRGGFVETISDFPSETARWVYVRLWSVFDSGSFFRDYSLATQPLARFTIPSPGATIPGGSQLFAWTDPGNATYRLTYADPWQGQITISVGTATSARLGRLPATGNPLTVMLEQTIAGQRYLTSATFPTVRSAAEIFSPAVGATLPGATVDFEWNANGQRYQLFLGSTPGASDIGIFPASQAIFAPGLRATNLPVDGRRVHARLFTYFVDGTSATSDTTFTAATLPVPASISSPVDRAQLAGASQLFQWNDVGASGYQLWIGNDVGSFDIGAYPTPATTTTATAFTATGLPTDGRQLRARLWSQTASGFRSQDHVYAAAGTPPSPPAQLTAPADGSSFGPSGLSLAWSGAAERYEVWVGTRQGTHDVELIATTGTSAQVATRYNAIFLAAGYHVRLLSRIGGAWYFRDYFFAYQSP